VLLPFDNDLAIDEQSFRKHLCDVAAVEGLSAITINAHSTEVGSCTFDEQRSILEIAQEEIATNLPLIVFHYPLATGQGYPKDTLLKQCEEVPTRPRHQGLRTTPPKSGTQSSRRTQAVAIDLGMGAQQSYALMVVEKPF
jgi:dihydrodipicolinate synthase/N-acetylneuraminate lyase